MFQYKLFTNQSFFIQKHNANIHLTNYFYIFFYFQYIDRLINRKYGIIDVMLPSINKLNKLNPNFLFD